MAIHIWTQKCQRWIHSTNSCHPTQEVVNKYMNYWVTKRTLFSITRRHLSWTLLLATRWQRLRVASRLILQTPPSCFSSLTNLSTVASSKGCQPKSGVMGVMECFLPSSCQCRRRTLEHHVCCQLTYLPLWWQLTKSLTCKPSQMKCFRL